MGSGFLGVLVAAALLGQVNDGRPQVRRVTASFRALRNESWNPHLNRALPPELRESSAQLYLPFRARGFEFAGTLDVDLANTVEGWRILNRKHHSMTSFPLDGYLHCPHDPRSPDRELEIMGERRQRALLEGEDAARRLGRVEDGHGRFEMPRLADHHAPPSPARDRGDSPR